LKLNIINCVSTVCEKLLVSVCVFVYVYVLSHVLFTAANHSGQSHSLTLNPKKPREKQRERFSLTGTAAIRVGCRTL